MNFELQITDFIAQATESTIVMLMPIVEAFLRLPEQLPQLSEICTALLALAVLLLCRRVRRDRAAMRGMVTALEQHRMQIVATERLQEEMEDRFGRIGNDLADLRERQRSMDARVGKPDPQLAAAMARAGTRSQDMVDCGLSHGEVHLLQALNAVRPRQAQPEAAAEV